MDSVNSVIFSYFFILFLSFARAGIGKSYYCVLSKNGVFVEQEYSRFEMFFRDFFRFLLLHDERKLDVGVLVTYDSSAFER